MGIQEVKRNLRPGLARSGAKRQSSLCRREPARDVLRRMLIQSVDPAYPAAQSDREEIDRSVHATLGGRLHAKQSASILTDQRRSILQNASTATPVTCY